jgi:hypothetical protein
MRRAFSTRIRRMASAAAKKWPRLFHRGTTEASSNTFGLFDNFEPREMPKIEKIN